MCMDQHYHSEQPIKIMYCIKLWKKADDQTDTMDSLLPWEREGYQPLILSTVLQLSHMLTKWALETWWKVSFLNTQTFPSVTCFSRYKLFKVLQIKQQTWTCTVKATFRLLALWLEDSIYLWRSWTASKTQWCTVCWELCMF